MFYDLVSHISSAWRRTVKNWEHWNLRGSYQKRLRVWTPVDDRRQHSIMKRASHYTVTSVRKKTWHDM